MLLLLLLLQLWWWFWRAWGVGVLWMGVRLGGLLPELLLLALLLQFYALLLGLPLLLVC